MAPPTKTRACAFAGRSPPRVASRSLQPSRAAATRERCRSYGDGLPWRGVEPRRPRGRRMSIYATRIMVSRKNREKSRPPVGRRGSIGGRSGGFGAEDALRWVNELKLERRNRFCPRRAGSDRRILGVLSASTSTSNRVLSQLVLVAGVQTSGVSCVGSLPIAWGDLPRRFLRVGARSRSLTVPS